MAKRLGRRGAKADLARELGVAIYVISKWASGDRKPPPPERAKIQDKLRIGWKLWDEAPFPDTGDEPREATR